MSDHRGGWRRPSRLIERGLALAGAVGGMIPLHAGLVEYSHATGHASGEGGSVAWGERVIGRVEAVVAWFMPGQPGFWVGISVVVLIVVTRLAGRHRS